MRCARCGRNVTYRRIARESFVVHSPGGLSGSADDDVIYCAWCFVDHIADTMPESALLWVLTCPEGTDRYEFHRLFVDQAAM